ncbi:MAG: hypothetical protein U9N59_00965 [Campylobacterota bacterium]|nr:hypothetical protein [Campylobacterota bacterium]
MHKIKALPPKDNKHKAGYIDSLILKDRSFEHIFKDKNYFKIEIIKGIGFKELYRWIQEFGKQLNRNICEAKIVHWYKGKIHLALVRYTANIHMQNLIFAGINGYTEKSVLLKELLLSLIDDLQYCYVTRVDVAKDFIGKTPLSVMKRLATTREKILHYKNSIYFKTLKEKKSNTRINAIEYDKAKKDKLPIRLRRVEISYRGGYLKNVMLKDLLNEFSRIEKSFKSFTSDTMKIMSLESL